VSRELPLLVELEQGEQRHRNGDAVGVAHRLVEVEAATPQQSAQELQSLGDGDLRHGDVAYVHLGRQHQHLADRLGQRVRFVDGGRRWQRRRAQAGGQRGRAEAETGLIAQHAGEVLGRLAVAVRIEQAIEQLRRGLPGVEFDLLDLLAGQHQPGLELEQGGDQHQELGRRL